MRSKRIPVPFTIGLILVHWITYNQISLIFGDGEVFLDYISRRIIRNNNDNDIDNDAPTVVIQHHNYYNTSAAATAAATPKHHETLLAWNFLEPNNNSIQKYKYHKVRLTVDDAFMWKGRQRRLCKRIKKERAKLLDSSTRRNNSNTATITTTTTTTTTTIPRMVLYLGLPCELLHKQHRHGNLVVGLYAMHLAAMAHDADLIFVCKEEENQYDNLFWWLQSLPHTVDYKRQLLLLPQRTRTQQATSNKPSSSAACSGMGKIPLEYTSELVKYDLRRMALAIFGARTPAMHQFLKRFPEPPAASSTSSTASWSSRRDSAPVLLPTHPLYPEMELDSVAIHFRCGDVLSNLDANINENYGLIPFYVYRNVLMELLLLENDETRNMKSSNSTSSSSTTTTSSTNTIPTIGIITAPFDPHHLRRQDARHASQCQELVEMLQGYLQSHFPLAKVSIRNDPKTDSKTIPMVYARLILADQASICIRSTFCVFPTLASFARKRVFLEGGVSYFVSNVVGRRKEQDEEDGAALHLLDSKQIPYLYSHEIEQMGWNATLEWLMRREEEEEEEGQQPHAVLLPRTTSMTTSATTTAIYKNSKA